MPEPQESETIFDEGENQETGTARVAEGEEQLEAREGGVSETPETEGEGTPQEKPDFDGLPFKDVQALVKGYKDLQSRATRRDQEFVKLTETLKEVLPRLPQQKQQEVQENPEQFVREFVQNPRQVLNDLIKTALTTTLKETVEPIQGQVRSLSGVVELQRFLENHPELEDGDENLIMEIMDKYPEIGQRQDRLEVWLKLLKDERPDLRDRMAKAKAGLEKGASDAKKAASLGGKKSSTPGPSQKDEFDELIDLWKDRRKFFER